jgi:hypothetical protein
MNERSHEFPKNQGPQGREGSRIVQKLIAPDCCMIPPDASRDGFADKAEFFV